MLQSYVGTVVLYKIQGDAQKIGHLKIFNIVYLAKNGNNNHSK
jgi:hypothetical protein